MVPFQLLLTTENDLQKKAIFLLFNILRRIGSASEVVQHNWQGKGPT